MQGRTIPWPLRTLALLLVHVALVGCGEPKPTEPALYPVHGSLFVDGKPAAGATVQLVPVGGSPATLIPAAVVREDGTFSVSYHGKEDGVPPGEYGLRVFWLETPPGGGLPYDRLRGQFFTPGKPVTRVKVVVGVNQLDPIRLQSGLHGR